MAMLLVGFTHPVKGGVAGVPTAIGPSPTFSQGFSSGGSTSRRRQRLTCADIALHGCPGDPSSTCPAKTARARCAPAGMSDTTPTYAWSHKGSSYAAFGDVELPTPRHCVSIP